MKYKFKFIDLFSGIGGFHLGLASVKGKCVMACDIDRYANESYKHNFNMEPHSDIKDITSGSIPDFDLLCAGFPCQSFSNIGPNGGLSDSRGALIFQVIRILRDRQPKSFILENVKGIVNHNSGKTLSLIIDKIEEAGYTVYYRILEAKDFDLPQIRKRLFIVGIHNKYDIAFNFPKSLKPNLTLNDVFGGIAERKYAFTIRIGGRRSGINNRFNWDCYIVDGKPRYVTLEEGLRLQGFPANFFLAGNTDQKFKQVGNSVPTTIVREIGAQLVETDIFTPNSSKL